MGDRWLVSKCLSKCARRYCGEVYPGIIGAMLLLLATPGHADVPSEWNEIAVRTAAAVGGGTAGQSRIVAIMHVAMFDAVNSVEKRYTPYAADLAPHRATSAEAAGVVAAHAVLCHYVPQRKSELDDALSAALEKVADGAAKEAGKTVGLAVARRIIQLRADDGMDAKIDYTPGSGPGVWQPTPAAYAAAGGTQLGRVKPFTLRSADQFSMPAPPALDGDVYTRDALEIQSIGARDSRVRTPEQTDVAVFWTISTHVPFNAAARAAIAQRNYSLVDGARLFALLNMAGTDSQIACWHWKYHFNFWRPVTAIRAADTTSNPALRSDPSWEPLLNTPSHPDYPSGHACYGGAAAEVLRTIVGEDSVAVTVPGPSASKLVRTYTSFSQMDRDIIDARVWGGIHFRNTDENSSALGRSIGEYAVKHWFTPYEKATDHRRRPPSALPLTAATGRQAP